MSELLPFPGPFWFIVQQNQVKYITARRPKDVHVFEEPTFIETESVTEVFLDAKKGISGAIPGPKGSIFSNHPYIFHYDEFLQFQRAGLIVRYRIRLADFIVMMLYRHLKNTVKDLGWECNDDEVAAWVIQLYRGNYPSWFFRIERQSDEPNEYVQITRDKAKFTVCKSMSAQYYLLSFVNSSLSITGHIKFLLLPPIYALSFSVSHKYQHGAVC